MKKTDKISVFASKWQNESTKSGLDPRFIGYFELFNNQKFYEAHDVLEDLWLAQGKSGANYGFYKGLIQLAGSFVHLQKNRLRPAGALFRLSKSYLNQYPDSHERIDLKEIYALIDHWEQALTLDSGRNPLHDLPPPQIKFL